MHLSDKLKNVSHREVAGSDSYAAFEFQLIFGVEILFEKFDNLTDYAVLFEFHDDVVLLTGAERLSDILCSDVIYQAIGKRSSNMMAS